MNNIWEEKKKEMEEKKKNISISINNELNKKGWKKVDLAKNILKLYGYDDEIIEVQKDTQRQKVGRWTRISKDKDEPESYPTLNELADLSTVFECDISHLLGEYQESTKTIHDICERTHLSEKAVTNLLKYCDGISREHNARLFDVKENRYSILNALLENDDFFRLLYDIDEYKKGLPIGSPEKFDLWATSQVSGNLQREFANIIDDITETKELRKQRQELIDKAKLKTPKDE